MRLLENGKWAIEAHQNYKEQDDNSKSYYTTNTRVNLNIQGS